MHYSQLLCAYSLGRPICSWKVTVWSRLMPDSFAGVDFDALAARARLGDRDAYALIYKRYYGPITRIAWANLPSAAVEDAVAETFARAWTALPRYRTTGVPFVAWLYAIARHVITDAHRRARREVPAADLAAPPFEGQSDDRVILSLALGQLPADQRRVIELKFYLGLTNSDVGRALGKSPGAVNTTQWRALARLRAILGEH